MVEAQARREKRSVITAVSGGAGQRHKRAGRLRGQGRTGEGCGDGQKEGKADEGARTRSRIVFDCTGERSRGAPKRTATGWGIEGGRERTECRSREGESACGRGQTAVERAHAPMAQSRWRGWERERDRSKEQSTDLGFEGNPPDVGFLTRCLGSEPLLRVRPPCFCRCLSLIPSSFFPPLPPRLSPKPVRPRSL